MIPLRDHTKTHSFPFINYLIIMLNILVFMIQLSAPEFEQFVIEWAFIPKRFGLDIENQLITVFSSMFMHGGFMHIASNMWFLHIFGDNVEDALGHLKYLVFYLLCGVGAVGLQYFFSSESVIPMLGASGAISGVSGAYFVYFRDSKIETLVPFLGFFQVILLPSTLFLGYWFLIQVFNGAGSLLTYEVNEGGVAWFAHIGGFVTGFLLASLWKSRIVHSDSE